MGGRIKLSSCPQASTRHQSSKGQRYDKWIKQARRHERWSAQMIKQADATFQEVFSQARLHQVTTLVFFLHSSPPLHEWRTGHHCAAW